MITAILSALGGLGRVIGGYFTYKAAQNSQRREAEKDVKKEESEMEEKKRQIREAVYGNDDKKVTELAAKLIAPVVVAAAMWCGGCATKAPETVTVYVPTDRRIETCTNSLGIACKAVPNAVMAEMLERLELLKTLETELKVERRVTK